MELKYLQSYFMYKISCRIVFTFLRVNGKTFIGVFLCEYSGNVTEFLGGWYLKLNKYYKILTTTKNPWEGVEKCLFYRRRKIDRQKCQIMSLICMSSKHSE